MTATRKTATHTYQKPAYTDHNEIPKGTGVFKKTVLQIVPASPVTLWRMVEAGKFPKPVGHAGDRPIWNIDHVRAFMNGTWKPEQSRAA